MKKSFVIAGSLALELGIAGFSISNAFAYQGDPLVQGPNYTSERHEAMTQAFENNDYESWKALMAGRGRVSEVINADNFSQFAQAHTLAAQGKTAEAQAIRQNLGLGNKNGAGCANQDGSGKGFGRHGQNRAVNR